MQKPGSWRSLNLTPGLAYLLPQRCRHIEQARQENENRVYKQTPRERQSVDETSSYSLIPFLQPYSYRIPGHLVPSETPKLGPGLFYENKCHKCRRTEEQAPPTFCDSDIDCTTENYVPHSCSLSADPRYQVSACLMSSVENQRVPEQAPSLIFF